MSWYLQVADNSPQLFSILGLSRLKRQLGSQKAGVFSFSADGQLCDSDPLATEGALCAVLWDATPFFCGRLHEIPRKGSGRAESVDYELLDAWHDFEKNVYQQQWNVIVSVDESGNPTTAAEYRGECILGMDLNGNVLNSGQVIADAVAWAMSVGANCQLGSIGVGAPVPMDEITDLPCSEVIKKMLRYTPDAVTWLDYTTSPPSFNITRRALCLAVTVPFGGDVEDVNIKALPDLLAPSVVIRYLQENTTDGVPSVNVIPDLYPDGVTGLEYGALVMTTRLAGTNSTFQKQPVVTNPIPQDASDSNAIPWLMRKTAWLRQFSPDRITVNSLAGAVDPDQVDSNGNPKDSTFGDYPNEVVSGDIAPWMGVISAYVTVTASISYQYPDSMDAEANQALAIFGPSNGSLPGYNNMVTLMIHATGTDAATQTYSQLSTYTGGEPVPVGLAQEIFDSLSTLQYEGSYETVGQEISTWRLGTLLNLAGGRSEWETMGALVQEIVDDLDNGRTTLNFGPAGHLTLQDLMEQLRANRSRTTSTHLKERQSGQPGDDPSVNGPGQGQDTHHAPPPAPTVYPWENFTDAQDNDDGTGATWDVVLGYGDSSFAGDDSLDHPGPIEEFEISVGNDNSGWTGPDYDSSDLYNVFSVISGDSDYTQDRLWIGATDGTGDGGGVLINPSDPSITLGPNLDPAQDTGDDQEIVIDLSDCTISMQDNSGDSMSIVCDSGDGGTVLTLTGSDGGTVDIDTSDLEGNTASFQQISLCVDGVAKNAYVLMTTPM